MKYDSDLKDTEQRVYLLFHKDGFLDIAVGLCVLTAGLVVANDLAFLWIIFALIDIIAWRTAKKYVTLPRIGQTSYSKERKGRNSILIGLAFFSFMSSCLPRHLIKHKMMSLSPVTLFLKTD